MSGFEAQMGADLQREVGGWLKTGFAFQRQKRGSQITDKSNRADIAKSRHLSG